MAPVIDTLAAFEAFARKAALESPVQRESLWRERYEAAHPDVFEGFYETWGSSDGRTAVVRELSAVRKRVQEAAPVVRQHIRELDSSLPEILGRPSEPAPTHVLMVGTFSTNAAVGRLGDHVAVFHCLEWYQSAEGSRVLVAHEATHAWHEIALGKRPPDDDAAWMVFSEGLAVQASRVAVPDQAEEDYFWYGHPQSEDWLPWCQEHRDALRDHLRIALDKPETIEAFFGGGFVDGRWRVGYFVADDVVSGLGMSLPELVAMDVDQAKTVVRDALGAPPERDVHGAPSA